jgi:hypothetical protein
LEIQKERKVFNTTMKKENVFTASKYEKEIEEYLEKLHTEEETVVNRWMHMQSSRERTSTTFQEDRNEKCQPALEAHRITSTTTLQRETKANIKAHRNAQK